jgi:hypothetical protein
MVERACAKAVMLFSDVPGDERKVRAILADWGLDEAAISCLLTEEGPHLRGGDEPTAPRPRARQTDAAQRPAAPRAH